MAEHGGKREGAGRPPGSGVKARAAPLHEGIMPIDYLLAIMRGKKYDENSKLVDDDIPIAIRLDAGKAAAPYLYPRLSAIDSTVDVDGKIAITVVRYSPERGEGADNNTE